MDSLKLVILQSYKTKQGDVLTKQAIRQSEIIRYLKINTEPQYKTRVSISKHLATKYKKKKWVVFYSGIYRDIADVLIPLKLIEQEGIIPIKHGPRALQKEGMPYYKVTDKGLILLEILDKIDGLQSEIKKEKQKALELLI